MEPTGNRPIADDGAGDAALGDPARDGVAPLAAAPPRPDDAQQLHGNRVATGLTPLVWGAVVVLGVLVVLIWQLT